MNHQAKAPQSGADSGAIQTLTQAQDEAMQRRRLANLERSIREVEEQIDALSQLRWRMQGDVTAIKAILSSSDSGASR